jgi:HEAT repeat protein
VRRIALGAACFALLAAFAPEAGAHVVYDRTTLRQLAASSELVLRVEIASPLRVWSAADGSDHQEYFSARVIEAVKGSSPGATLDFFSHAEGEPRWRPKDQALVFLDRAASRAEFAPLAERFPWFSIQGAGLEWSAPRGEEKEIVRAAHAWAELGPDAKIERVRELVLKSLRSPSSALRADALSELVRVREAPGFFAKATDVRPFAALTAQGPLSFPQRVALVKLLESAPGFDAAARLRTLAQGPLPAADQATLIRVAGSVPDPKLSAWLAGLLAAPDATVRRDAVTALGRPWHAEHTPAVAAATADPDPAVARAAVRALGRIGSSGAQDALEKIATSEGFLGVLAAAEVRTLSTPALAPSSAVAP